MGRWVSGGVNLIRAVVSEVLTRAVVFGWAATSLVVAISGPFGTFVTRSFLWRLAYWGGLIAVAIVLAMALRVIFRAWFKNRSEVLEDFSVAASLSVIFGSGVVLLNRSLAQSDADMVMDVTGTIAVTFAISVSIIFLRRWMQGPLYAMRPARDRLLDRINAPAGVRLARVSSDNHHIRITTDDGEEFRILMRLRDALAEIDVEPGVSIHRSHWLALYQIAAVENHDGREVVLMLCGDAVPIGPKYRSNLVNCGIITA